MKLRTPWTFFVVIIILALSLCLLHRRLKSPDSQARRLLFELQQLNNPPSKLEKFLSRLGTSKNIDWTYREIEYEIFCRIIELGDDAVPALLDALRNENKTLRKAASACLSYIKPTSVEAESALVELLKDEDINVRLNAALALTVISSDAHEKIPLILQSFSREDHPRRYSITRFMGEICPKNDLVISELVDVLKNEDVDVNVRIITLMLLKEIGPAAQKAVPYLIEALNDKDFQVRLWSANALVNIDSSIAVPKVFDVLMEALNQDYYRATSIMLLGKIGPQAKESIPYLQQALKDDDWQTRHEAARSLVKIDPDFSTNPAIDVLIDDLKNGDETVRMNSARILGRIGPAACKAVHQLNKILIDQHGYIIYETALALYKIDPQVSGQQVINFINDRLQNFGVSEEEMYIRILGEIGPAAKNAVPTLIGFLKNQEGMIRVHAAESLGNIGSEAQEAIPALKDASKDNKAMVRLAAAEALQKIEEKN